MSFFSAGLKSEESRDGILIVFETFECFIRIAFNPSQEGEFRALFEL